MNIFFNLRGEKKQEELAGELSETQNNFGNAFILIKLIIPVRDIGSGIHVSIELFRSVFMRL